MGGTLAGVEDGSAQPAAANGARPSASSSERPSAVGSCTIAWPRRCESTRPLAKHGEMPKTPPTLRPARCASSLVGGASSIASRPARVRPIKAASAPGAFDCGARIETALAEWAEAAAAERAPRRRASR